MTDPTRDPTQEVRAPGYSARSRDAFDTTLYGIPSADIPQPTYVNPPYPPAEPARPRSHRRKGHPIWWFLASFALVLGVIAAATVALSGRNVIALPGHVLEDPGVAACRILAVNQAADPAPGAPKASAKASPEAQQRANVQHLRDMFSKSHFDDIKNNGVALMNIALQLIDVDGDSAGLALLAGGDFVTIYAGLAGACGDKGVPLKPLSSK